MAESANSTLAGRAAFAHPDFVRFQRARFFIVITLEMQSVAVGWQVYEITKRPLDLGLVGLAQFLPGILLFLLSGQAVDRFNRRKLLTFCYGGFALCSGLLLAIAQHGVHSAYPIYAVIALVGAVRSFNGPTARAILPQLVPEQHFPNAVAWNASIFQTATILGPAIGGLLYAFAHGPSVVYGAAGLIAVASMLSTLRIRPRTTRRPRQQISLTTVLAGLRYIWQQKLILGSISLDLFAVLLGGAVALLPVYAREILKTGPWGLGLLRSAPGVGAAAMALLLAHRPVRRRAGATMLWCVTGFGVFTILFGISHNLWLSLIALVLVGATDMVSVVIRGILVQVATPDEMRGRVNAVDMIFIGASNELGQFESGLTAHWFGTVPAVVLGGVGTLLVIAIWAWRFPELRQADQLSGSSA
ncbi:MAG TPA: MFS transporter [Terriglobales bacterium]|jgi:MFS family permease|nr:MFS transporter [Terriglobales bacterium]